MMTNTRKITVNKEFIATLQLNICFLEDLINILNACNGGYLKGIDITRQINSCAFPGKEKYEQEVLDVLKAYILQMKEAKEVTLKKFKKGIEISEKELKD